jgi:hypothetical protein
MPFILHQTVVVKNTFHMGEIQHMQSGRAWEPIPIRGATDKILILAFKRVQEHQNRPRNEGDMVKTLLDSLFLLYLFHFLADFDVLGLV